MRDELTMSLCAVRKSYWMERKRRGSSGSGHTVGEVREVAFSTWAQKLWQYRSWGALAGEHKHKQRQTPCYLVRSNLIGFKGDEVAATEDAWRTGKENKWTATKWILNDWLRNAKNKGVRGKKLHLCILLTNRLLYPCFYVFLKLWWEERRPLFLLNFR
jgi:hypothetical protein